VGSETETLRDDEDPGSAWESERPREEEKEGEGRDSSRALRFATRGHRNTKEATRDL